MKEYQYWVYIMASNTGTLYIGFTNNLRRRASEHKQDIIEGFTKKYQCHSESCLLKKTGEESLFNVLNYQPRIILR